VPLPVNAQLQAAQSFVRDVRASGDFMRQQDDAGADAPYGRLLAHLAEARELLRWNPACGRPARFLQAQSFQGQALAERAIAQAAVHGLPHLRELIVKPYVLVYAHGQDRVLLLALKHERQLSLGL